MKFSKQFYILSIILSLLACRVTYADTCYDPNYNSYYNCSGDEYIAPVAAGLLFGAVIAGDNNNGYHHHGHYNNRNHGGHGGGNHGGNGRNH